MLVVVMALGHLTLDPSMAAMVVHISFEAMQENGSLVFIGCHDLLPSNPHCDNQCSQKNGRTALIKWNEMVFLFFMAAVA